MTEAAALKALKDNFSVLAGPNGKTISKQTLQDAAAGKFPAGTTQAQRDALTSAAKYFTTKDAAGQDKFNTLHNNASTQAKNTDSHRGRHDKGLSQADLAARAAKIAAPTGTQGPTGAATPASGTASCASDAGSTTSAGSTANPTAAMTEATAIKAINDNFSALAGADGNISRKTLEDAAAGTFPNGSTQAQRDALTPAAKFLTTKDASGNDKYGTLTADASGQAANAQAHHHHRHHHNQVQNQDISVADLDARIAAAGKSASPNA